MGLREAPMAVVFADLLLGTLAVESVQELSVAYIWHCSVLAGSLMGQL